MPVYIRKNVSFTPPSIDKFSLEDDDDYVTDPDQLKDDLPQPYRMIDKILTTLIDDVCEILDVQENARLAEASIYQPPKYDCGAKVENCSNTSCLAASEDGVYMFLGKRSGLEVMDSSSQRLVSRWEETGVDIISVKAHMIGPQTYMLVTVDDMGFARLFAVAGDHIFLLKLLNEQDGATKLIASNCRASLEGDYIGINLENPASGENWLEIHRLPKESWLKELDTLLPHKLEKKETHQESESIKEGTDADQPSAPSPLTKSSSPVPPDKPITTHKFTLPTLVLRLRPTTPIKGCTAPTIHSACQKVDSADVVGLGYNHILSDSHLDQRSNVFNVLHDNLLSYLPKEEKVVQPVSTANFHFLNAGRMVPLGLEQPGSINHPTTVAVWWTGETHMLHFSLLKTSKDPELKPDLVWPYTCRITSTAISKNTAWMAVGLENGTVVLWDRYLGVQRGLINVDATQITDLHFLDSRLCPQLETEYPPYRTKSCARLLAVCKNGCIYNVCCSPGEDFIITCVSAATNDDNMVPTTVIPFSELPELILFVQRNGQIKILDTEESVVLCEVVLPENFELTTPWDPAVMLGGLDRVLFVRGTWTTEQEVDPGQESGELFVFQIALFPTLDSFWSKKRPPALPYVHCTADTRVETLLAERIAQQGLRKTLMQERWYSLRQEIQNIQNVQETAQRNFEARPLYRFTVYNKDQSPESVGWDPVLT